MEQIKNNIIADRLNFESPQKVLSQGMNNPEQKECDKNVQGIVSNSELSKKDSDSMKNLGSLDEHEAKSVVVPYEKKEGCNKPGVENNELNSEDKKSLRTRTLD